MNFDQQCWHSPSHLVLASSGGAAVFKLTFPAFPASSEIQMSYKTDNEVVYSPLSFCLLQGDHRQANLQKRCFELRGIVATKKELLRHDYNYTTAAAPCPFRPSSGFSRWGRKISEMMIVRCSFLPSFLPSTASPRGTVRALIYETLM